MNLSSIFTLIGIIFGALFVFINAGALPGPWSIVVRVIGVIAVLAALWVGLMRRNQPSSPTPDRQSIRTYWTAVIAEVIAIPVGAMVLNAVFDRPELVVLWVVFVVGVHFLPARAFGIPTITLLGGAMIALAVLGTIATLAIDELAAPITAVIAGFVMLAFSATAAWSAHA